eukprot:1158662-Pelagomonas_calceolata.AAC.9
MVIFHVDRTRAALSFKCLKLAEWADDHAHSDQNACASANSYHQGPGPGAPGICSASRGAAYPIGPRCPLFLNLAAAPFLLYFSVLHCYAGKHGFAHLQAGGSGLVVACNTGISVSNEIGLFMGAAISDAF